MKYETQLVIDLPREKVIELFDNPDNLPQWQKGLVSFEPLSGQPGEPGARSRLIFDPGGRRIEMVETIKPRKLPEVGSGTYAAPGLRNQITNHFHDDGNGRTRWVGESEFRCMGVTRLLSVVVRGSFPVRTRENRAAFKRFAASQAPSPHAGS